MTILDRNGIPLTVNELRRRVVSAAARAEGCLCANPEQPEAAQAWAAVTHALIAAAAVQAELENAPAPQAATARPDVDAR
ncbi:hypothetical protein [Kitasatospora sp. NPDC005751]|uniref:hypothetical protein n=1 Tax=Kitasatospora sp. NPDC005751 TaxID=3157064 RepID=UPI0033E8373C